MIHQKKKIFNFIIQMSANDHRYIFYSGTFPWLFSMVNNISFHTSRCSVLYSTNAYNNLGTVCLSRRLTQSFQYQVIVSARFLHGPMPFICLCYYTHTLSFGASEQVIKLNEKQAKRGRDIKLVHWLRSEWIMIVIHWY